MSNFEKLKEYLINEVKDENITEEEVKDYVLKTVSKSITYFCFNEYFDEDVCNQLYTLLKACESDDVDSYGALFNIFAMCMVESANHKDPVYLEEFIQNNTI